MSTFEDTSTQIYLLIIHFRDMANDVFQCRVQMCAFPLLDSFSEGQVIPRQIWKRWEPEGQTHQSDVQVQVQDCDNNESDIESDNGATLRHR